MDFDQEKLKRMLISLSRVLNLVRSQSFENNRSIAIALYSLVFFVPPVSLHMYASQNFYQPAI